MKHFALLFLTLSFSTFVAFGQGIIPTPGTNKPGNKPKPTLTLSTTSLNFPATGGSKTITVNASSGKWSVSDPIQWLKLITEGNTITVNVGNNSGTYKRKTYFSVHSGNLSRTVHITQEAASNSIDTTSNTYTADSYDNRSFTFKGVSFKMIKVQGGTFTMGCTSEQSDCYGDESPTHNVSLSNYYIGETEVTQALWRAVMGTNPSYFQGDSRPVEQVDWYDAVEFCNKLSSALGLQPYYNINKSVQDPNNSSSSDKKKFIVTINSGANGFRLPTEAEWEFAARGGNKTNRYQYAGSGDIGAVAWYSGNSGDRTCPVKTKQPNELGMYDMSGNVWEWCWDWKGNYSSYSQTNPTGPSSGSLRVYRGGSWSRIARYCRVSTRNDNTPGLRDNILGFRLAL